MIEQQYRISPEKVDLNALWVIKRLRAKGYEAYLTGGCVRDLLLGKAPKDFDVATNAKPDELKKVFRNCRLVGRRFLLAHIYFPEGKVIETATFRKNPLDVQEDMPEDLLVLKDNEYGNLSEDVKRRDFTINGLFYDPVADVVMDEAGGQADLQAGLIRTIGDPNIRFQEDPVRILRGVKFACRLGFSIEEQTFLAMKQHLPGITRCAPARVQEEIVRLLTCGQSEKAFALCEELGFFEIMLPELLEGLTGELVAKDKQAVLGPKERKEAFFGMLKAFDQVLSYPVHVPTSVVFAVLLLPIYQAIENSDQNERNWLDRLCVAWAERIRLSRHDQDRLRILLSSLDLLGQTQEAFQKNQFLVRKSWFRELMLLYIIQAVYQGQEFKVIENWKSLAAHFHKPYKQDQKGQVSRMPFLRRKKPSFKTLKRRAQG